MPVVSVSSTEIGFAIELSATRIHCSLLWGYRQVLAANGILHDGRATGEPAVQGGEAHTQQGRFPAKISVSGDPAIGGTGIAYRKHPR